MAVVLTGDYLADPAFAHAEDTDRVVARHRHPLDGGGAARRRGDGVRGDRARSRRAADAFSPSAIALVRALADHAAAAMANVRLIEDLDASRRELAERADVERSLREIAARISAATDLPAVLQLGVDEAVRLLDADGARIDLIDPTSGLLRWAYASGAVRPDDDGVAGRPGRDARPGRVRPGGRHRAGVLDRRLHQRHAVRHGLGADSYVAASGVRSVMAAPLTGESGPFGALTIFTEPARRVGREPTPRSSRRSPTRPPSRSGRPGCSTSSTGRARPWPAGPRPSRRCARSPPGSRSCASRPRSSRTSSSRPAAWSRRTASSST